MKDIRTGNGYDVHALAMGLPLWLGGIRIEDSPIGCVAHSDGDVALHALCDALLGCLALGDIGKYFPDTSDEWKGIDSKILLARVVEMIHERGWQVGNVDITIALQRPKLAPHIAAMREAIAPHPRCRPRRRQRQGHHHRAPRLRRPRRGLRGLGQRTDLEIASAPFFLSDWISATYRKSPMRFYIGDFL